MNLKKLLSGVLACCVIGGALPYVSMPDNNAVITASAADSTEGTYESLTYKKRKDYIEISGCDDSATEVVIPAEIDGVPVTRIGESAFYSFWGTNLTKITIPDSVTSIGEGSFSGCSGLTSIIIPNSVKFIGDHAFSGCSGLTSITIPNSVKSMGSYAFSGCSGLTEITIPDNIKSIGNSTFSGCSELIEILIPDSVTSIGDSAFSDCSELTEITIPDTVTTIGKGAFSGCSKLTEITIPDSITSFKGGIFLNCTGLTEITISDNVTEIDGWSFMGCTGLTSINVSENNENFADIDGVLCNKDKTKLLSFPKGKSNAYTIPNCVTSIGDYAFHECSKLTEITIPNSVTSIGFSAFQECSELTEITIPDSVTDFNYISAFYECSRLKSINVSENNENYTDIDGVLCNKDKTHLLLFPNGKSTTYIIPNCVTTIGLSAFYNCSELTEVTIPDSVTNIGRDAFYRSGLTSITILNPECIIYPDSGTISNISDIGLPIYFNGTIYGYENSTAQAYAEKYNRKFVALSKEDTTTEPSGKSLSGDANVDGEVTVADAAAILQYLGNNEAFPLTAQGKKNGDVDGKEGLTPADALSIQKFKAGLVSKLPL